MAKRRAYGAGSIFLRGKYYYLQTCINGKTKLTSLKTSSRQEAEAKANSLKPVMEAKTKEDVARHIADARKLSAARTLPLLDAWDKYKASPLRPDSSLGTLGNYERHWGQFVQWLQGRHPEIQNVGEIRSETAREYASHLSAKPISFNTYNYHVQSSRLVCRILSEEGYLEENPFAGFKPKKGEQQERKDFTLDEVHKILESFDDGSLNISNKREMRTLFHLLAFSGLRLADAVLLKWDAVDRRRNMIVCRPMKTRQIDREVHIPIHSAIIQELERAKEWRKESPFILPILAGRYQANRCAVVKDCIDIIEACGFTERNGAKIGRDRRKYGMHSFRHFFASQCAMSGVPIALLADILGDNIQTLQRYYLHSNDAAREKVLASLPSRTILQDQESELPTLRAQAHMLVDALNAEGLKTLLLGMKNKKTGIGGWTLPGTA